MPNFPFFGFPFMPFNINKETPSSNDFGDSPIFDFFGIRLYIDDLIILGVLFFLYQEKVHDDMLYMILFLLLFS